MNEDLFNLDAIAFVKKWQEGNVALPEKRNKGEFYRARKDGKAIYFLGTDHGIGCSEFASKNLAKVKKQLDEDGVSKIDNLWTEVANYNFLQLDSYYFQGLKNITERIGTLDEITWEFVSVFPNLPDRGDDSSRAASCQAFMRGYPVPMYPAPQRSLSTLKLEQLSKHTFWRNKQWVQKLLNGNENQTQFVVTGAAHNWFNTGVLKLLEEKGWEIKQFDLNMNEKIIVTLGLLKYWEKRSSQHTWGLFQSAFGFFFKFTTRFPPGASGGLPGK